MFAHRAVLRMLRRGMPAARLLPASCPPPAPCPALATARPWPQGAQKLTAGTLRGIKTSHEYTLASQAKARMLSVPVGMGAGLFGSVLGVGGGVLIVPAITAAVQIPQRYVSGTSLAAVVTTGAISTYNFVSAGLLEDLAAAGIISSAALVTVPLGALMTARLPCHTLRRVMGWFLCCSAVVVPALRWGQQRGEGGAEQEPDPPQSPAMPAETLALLVCTGGVAGFASGLLGIGGGTIVTPLLALATPMSQASVIATSLLAMVPPSLVGLAQHHRMGHVDWRMGVGLSLGTAVGSFLGSKAAIQAPDGALEAAFTVGMLFLGWRTLSSLK